MGTFNHTPDPAQGALVDAAGVVVLPDDNEEVKADNITLGDEQIIDWIAYLTKGPANDIDFKITGNGTPPAGGYTPTTNPIIIKGTGLRVSGAPLNLASGATVTGAATVTATLLRSGSAAIITNRPSTLPPITSTSILGDSSDVWRQVEGLSGSISHTVQSTPAPSNGSPIRVHRNGSVHDVVLLREDASEICTLPASVFSSADLMYDTGLGKWILTGGYGLDLTTALPYG